MCYICRTHVASVFVIYLKHHTCIIKHQKHQIWIRFRKKRKNFYALLKDDADDDNDGP